MTFIAAKTSRNIIESAGHAYSMPQVSVFPRGNIAGRYRGEKAISKKREEKRRRSRGRNESRLTFGGDGFQRR